MAVRRDPKGNLDQSQTTSIRGEKKEKEKKKKREREREKKKRERKKKKKRTIFSSRYIRML